MYRLAHSGSDYCLERKGLARLKAEQSSFLCHRSPGEALREGLLERLPRRAGKRFLAVSPMPQIDGGLELVTTDGALAERLQRRVRRWPVEFLVRVRGELPEPQLLALRSGVLDDGRRVQIEDVVGAEHEAEGANRWYQLIAIGASSQDLRPLFYRPGALVSHVPRTRLGPLTLTRDLNRGHFRPLSGEEAASLRVEPAARDAAGDGPE